MYRNNSGWFWLLFLFLIFMPAGIFPLLLIIFIVLAVTKASVNSAKRRQNTYTQRNYQNNYTNYGYNNTNNSTDSGNIDRINTFLRGWYRGHSLVTLHSGYELRLNGAQYASLSSLDVYQNGRYICPMNDFKRRYAEQYRNMLSELDSLSRRPRSSAQDDVVDIEVTESQPKPKAEPKREPNPEPDSEKELTAAEKFIGEINGLNEDIPDENISNGLYETCVLLRQINEMEKKLPSTHSKLTKLYDYYLPILEKILQQFVSLQSAVTDPSYGETKDKLTRTIQLINDAMKNIISSMTDQDFINLSADISTLEAVLQKDGLTSEGRMTQPGEQKNEGQN